MAQCLITNGKAWRYAIFTFQTHVKRAGHRWHSLATVDNAPWTPLAFAYNG